MRSPSPSTGNLIGHSRGFTARVRERWRAGWRRLLVHRRWLAAALTAAAVLVGLQAARPAPPPTRPVLVAAHALDSGTVLSDADLRTAQFAEGTVPEGALDAGVAIGRTLATPLSSGEPLTSGRLLAAGLTDGFRDDEGSPLTAVPLRLADVDAAALLRVGDRIDLYATDPEHAKTLLVAADVPVLALPRATVDQSAVTNPTGGTLIVIGTTESSVAHITGLAVRRYLTFAFAY